MAGRAGAVIGSLAGWDFLEMGIREARRVLEHILGLKQLSQRGRARQVGSGGRPNGSKMWDQAQRSASERKGIRGHLPWGQWPFPSPRPVVPRSQRPFKARCEGVSQAVGWGRPPARVPGWGGPQEVGSRPGRSFGGPHPHARPSGAARGDRSDSHAFPISRVSACARHLLLVGLAPRGKSPACS